MPKINQFPGTTTLATTDVMVTETSTGTNTRKIAYSDFRTQIQNESKSVFALKGEIASDAQVAAAVTDWLDANVTPTGSAVAIDDTLLVQGAAADAKATGEMIIINGTSTNGTRVNITTTNTDIVLAEQSDVDDLKNAVAALNQVYDYKGSVATTSALPSSGNTNGDLYVVEADGDNYVWDDGSWVNVGGMFGIADGSITEAKLSANVKQKMQNVYATVAGMVADESLAAGYSARTLGYYLQNDGGGAVYVISQTSSRAGSVLLTNGLYAVLVGDSHNTRQIGIRSGDRAQTTINAYIADTSFRKLTVLDEIHLKKPGAGSAINNIELIKIYRSDFELEFAANGKFVLDTLNDDYYRMIAVHGDSNNHANNIVIANPVLVGDADTIGLTSGEYGHGLYIYYADGIKVYNGNIGKCFGDAVDIGTDANDVTFIGTLYCYDCGRQGVSMINGNNVYFDTIVGENIKRTSPSAVIDFEPNSADQSIFACVKTVHAINCKKGVCVAGRGDKKITVDNIISDHTDGMGYDNDFMIYGTASMGEDYDVTIAINNITVTNQKNRCLDLEYLTAGISLNIGAVTIKGATKAGTNSVLEATVYFKNIASGGVVKNVKIGCIDVIGNTSPQATLGIFQDNAATYSNCDINYNDDSEQVVTCSLRDSSIINTHIKSNKNKNQNQFLNSTGEFYVTTGPTNFTAGTKINHVFIANPQGTNFNLYKTNLSGYTINTADFITDGSYYTFTGCHAITLYFNHTNKQINATKIA